MRLRTSDPRSPGYRRHPGDRLLVHRQSWQWHEIHGRDLNAYLHEASGTDLTAKDFRTWDATVLAAAGLAVSHPIAGGPQAARRGAESRAIREVAHYLGNTPAVCRASIRQPAPHRTLRRGRHHRTGPRRTRRGRGAGRRARPSRGRGPHPDTPSRMPPATGMSCPTG
ncbi:hypothetical protein [Kitasatospora sp. NPDC054795]